MNKGHYCNIKEEIEEIERRHFRRIIFWHIAGPIIGILITIIIFS